MSENPLQRLEAVEGTFKELLLHQVELEAKVVVLDHVVGFLQAAGAPKPSQEQLQAFWGQAVALVQAKYPGVTMQPPQVQKPALFLPSNGAIHLAKKG